MKTRTMILISLIGIFIISICYQLGQAEPEAKGTTLKIGIVSVRNVFQNCKKNIAYRTEAIAEQNRIKQELGDLAKEIESEEAALKAFRAGSSDYMEQVKSVLQKRANLEAKQEYLKQQRTIKDKQWSEQFYQEILLITKTLAEQKGLDLVFEKDEPSFPIPPEEFMLVISTHKLLYSQGCVDLTDEIIAKMDSKEG